MPPLEGGLVGDAARLGRALDGDVVANESDEGDPDGERLAAVLEDGAGEGGGPPAAAAAAPPRDPGRGGAVPPGASGADLVAVEPLVDVLSEQQELVGGQARLERPKGGSLFPYRSVPSARLPTRRDCRQTKIRVGVRANSLFGWEEQSIQGP